MASRAADVESYHLAELEIARSPAHPRHVAPSVPHACRAVLDVGCGAGQTLITADLPTGTLRYGVDPQLEVLQLGRRLTSGVCFVCARGEQLPLKSEAFDFVISRVALPYMRIPLALGEIARVMKPGGQLWLVLHPFSMTLREMLGSLRELALRDALLKMYVLLNGLAFHVTGRVFPLPFRHGRCESCQTEGGIRRALRRAGFRETEITRAPSFVVTSRKGPQGAAEAASTS